MRTAEAGGPLAVAEHGADLHSLSKQAKELVKRSAAALYNKTVSMHSRVLRATDRY